MTVRTRVARAAADVDEGFTLVEVIVALMLLTIVLMSGGAFMIRTISSSSEQTGRQGAVAVASQVMEQIRAVDPTFDQYGKSPLVYGRGVTDVIAQWTAAAAAGVDVSGTYTGNALTSFDLATYQTSSATPSVPFQQIVNRGNEKYTVTELIGTCSQAATGTVCDRSTTGNLLFRAIVRVTWASGAKGTCSGAACTFSVSTLIDPTQDPVFNANRKPVANPDSVSTPVNTAISIGVTVNDSGDFPLANAVTMITNPANGTTSQSNNIITYTPSSGFSGTNTFTYTVTDNTSRTSNVTTVTIKVTPVAVNDTATAAAGASPLTVAVLGNDRGTGLSLVSVTTPSIGTAAISGTSIRYTVPATGSGTVTMTYTAQDSSGQTYTGTFTVTVTGPAVVPLGTGSTYSVFSVSAVTSTGATTLSGDLGVPSAAALTGFPPGVANGTTRRGGSAFNQAQSDLTTAYNNASGRTPNASFSGNQGGKTYYAGVYNTTSAMALTGTLTLDGEGDPNSVFIFQVNGAMNTAAASTVVLTNGATADHVFWQVSGGVGIGANASFSGVILSGGAITLGNSSTLSGRALSYATVTLSANTIS